MTPQEQQLVAELFDRLTKLENAPRDPDAERLIADGARRAPHALYALVQTALIQDEALKRANARIQDLQQQLQARPGGEQPQPQQGSFLDAMREAVFGHDTQRDAHRGSVPSVQSSSTNAGAGGSPYQSQEEYDRPRGAPDFPAQSAYPPGYPPGGGFAPGGGSFLGTAASAAAGVIGGGLLLDGIRSMFSHRSGLGGRDPYAVVAPDDAARPEAVQPWRGDAASNDLARQAGIDDIGPHDTTVNQGDEQNVTDAPDAQFVDDDDFDTADAGGDDDNYDV